jgi:hypothetical protein
LGSSFLPLRKFFPAIGEFFPTTGKIFPVIGEFFPVIGKFFPAIGKIFPAVGEFFPATFSDGWGADAGFRMTVLFSTALGGVKGAGLWECVLTAEARRTRRRRVNHG